MTEAAKNPVRAFRQAATPAEWRALAQLAGTTAGTLQQLVGGYRTGGRAITNANTARRLEVAAQVLRETNPNLPALPRAELCPDCGACEFAKHGLAREADAEEESHA